MPYRSLTSVFSLALLLPTLAFAFGYTSEYSMPDGEYSCTIFPKGEKFKDYKTPFSFTVKEGQITCKKMWVEDDPDYGCEKHFDIKDFNDPKSPLFFLDSSDGGISTNNKGDVEISVDSDGVETGAAVLYKNSGFTKGAILSRLSAGSESDGEYYGTFFCEIN